MSLAFAFFINGNLNSVDYREFIRTNALSQEHLVSAKHFLQLESIFDDEIEMKLSQWYQEFTNLVMISVYQGNYFKNRHAFILDQDGNISQKVDAIYLDFMRNEVLPRILDFQQIVREDIRF